MPEERTVTARGRVRLVSVAAPIAGLAALYLLRVALLRLWSSSVVDAALGLVVVAGVLAFSRAVFHVIDRQGDHLARQHAELERRYATERRLRAQLEALHQASLTIASAHTSAEILQRLVDLACTLIGARYAALGVRGPQGAIDDFYTAGMTAEERSRLGPPPQGHGLLGVLMAEGAPLRIADIARDPRAVGVPPGHPPMTSVLGVPVAQGERIVGHLYLADKEGAVAFSPEDERLLTLLAAHAAVVIDNARLAAQVRTLAIAAERARIGQDLHDGVIQSLYAVNLALEEAVEDIDADPAAARARVDGAIDRVAAVMEEVRRLIQGLRPEPDAAESLTAELAALLADARVRTAIEPHLRVDGACADDVPPPVAREVLHIAREAVANVVRHARASRLWLTLEVAADAVHLRVVDDGAGFDPARLVPSGCRGLHTLRARVADLGGVLTVHAAPGEGTAIDVRTPLMAVGTMKREG